ncbi:VOC family protein [Kutzneria viridogrisea]
MSYLVGSVGDVATRLDSVVIDAADPPALVRWWADALDVEITHRHERGVGLVLDGLHLVFVPVAEPKRGHNRLHLDLASSSVEHQRATVRRLCSAGAVPCDIGQGEVPWVVLADPEGNEFCVLDPRPEYADTGPLAAVVVEAVNPLSLATFWGVASSWPLVRGDEDFASLRHSSGTGPWLEFIRGRAKTGRNRVHLEVRTTGDEDGLWGEVRYLHRFGAERIDIGQGEVRCAVLADPEGNELCVSTPG